MFTSEELNPVRGLTESRKAYRQRRISVGRKVADYLRTGRLLWDVRMVTMHAGRNAAKRLKKLAMPRFAA